jgi:CheY-like chemotaxis protein
MSTTQPHVLLIDASSAARYATRLMLQALGARVSQASSIEQSLPLIEAQPVDLILVAAALPGMNALEFLELPAVRGAGAAPVVVLRPDAHWPLTHVARQHGARAVLTQAELPTALPALLRDPGVRAAPATGPAAPLPSDASKAVSTAAAPMHAPVAPVAPASEFGRCWHLALPAALIGLVVGLWVAAVSAH